MRFVKATRPVRNERGLSKRLTAAYKSGPCKSWIKVRNPESPAYLRISDAPAASLLRIVPASWA